MAKMNSVQVLFRINDWWIPGVVLTFNLWDPLLLKLIKQRTSLSKDSILHFLTQGMAFLIFTKTLGVGWYCWDYERLLGVRCLELIQITCVNTNRMSMNCGFNKTVLIVTRTINSSTHICTCLCTGCSALIEGSTWFNMGQQIVMKQKLLLMTSRMTWTVVLVNLWIWALRSVTLKLHYA